MSFRDLRNLSEFLRKVGYPRLISLENFRTPNFKLVAEICQWLIKQYEPTADESIHNLDTEQGRVKFITYFAEFLLKHVQLRLNTKRLYQADGYAVKELIKVVTTLDQGKSQKFQGLGNGTNSNEDNLLNDDESGQLDLTYNIEELRRTRSLGLEITQRGGTLHDLLSKEITLREARYKALSKAYELEEVERVLNTAIKSSTTELNKAETMLENVTANVNAIQLKIDKKHNELERSEKRLQTLKKVKPAFMDEYEKLQGELEKCYREYVVRFRVLACLQNQVEELARLESDRKAEEKLIKQELSTTTDDDLLLYHHHRPNNILNGNTGGGRGRGGSYEDEDDDEEDEDEEDTEENSLQYNAREFMLSRGGSISRMRGPQEQSAMVRRTTGKNEQPSSSGPKGIVNTIKGTVTTANNGGRKTANTANNKSKPKNMYGNLLNGDEEDESESDVLLLEDDNLDQSELLSDDIDDDDEVDDIEDDLLEMEALDISDAPTTVATATTSRRVNNSDVPLQTPRKGKSSSTTKNHINTTTDPTKTYRKDSRYTSVQNLSNGNNNVGENFQQPKNIQSVPLVPPSTVMTSFENRTGYNGSNDDRDLIVPNGTIINKHNMSYISDEVDGFGDSSLTKPLEAPKTTIIPTSTVNSLTYRKSSKTSSRSSRNDEREYENGGHQKINGTNDIAAGGDSNTNRKKSSSKHNSSSHHRRSGESSSTGREGESSGSSRSRSSSNTSGGSHHGKSSRPESKSKSINHKNGGIPHHQHSVVVEEESEDIGDVEYPIPANYQLERPPARPGSHYSKKQNEMVTDYNDF